MAGIHPHPCDGDAEVLQIVYVIFAKWKKRTSDQRMAIYGFDKLRSGGWRRWAAGGALRAGVGVRRAPAPAGSWRRRWEQSDARNAVRVVLITVVLSIATPFAWRMEQEVRSAAPAERALSQEENGMLLENLADEELAEAAVTSVYMSP